MWEPEGLVTISDLFRRWTTQLDQSFWQLLLIGVVAGWYVAYVQIYGVNVPFWDEWDQIPLIHSFLHGQLPLAALWEQHNENRMLVPNLVAVGLAAAVKWNVKAEMWLSALMFISTYVALLCVGDWLRSPWMCVPPALVWFSLAQYENALWGFQVAWYLVLLCYILALAWLGKTAQNWLYLFAASGSAVVASFSSFQGLLIWPCGLFCLIAKRRSRGEIGAWAVIGLATTAVYFYHFNFGITGGPSLSFFVHHPKIAAQYLLTAIGSVVPSSEPGSLRCTQLLGLGILTLCLFSIAQWWHSWRSGFEDDGALAIALVLFGLLFDLALVIGRSGFGVQQAASSRYITYNLVLLVGLYWSLLEARARVSNIVESLRPYAIGAFAMLLLLQIPISAYWGIVHGRQTLANRLIAADVVVNYRVAPASLLEAYVYQSASFVRREAGVAERDGLSIFGTPQARVYAAAGIVPGGRLVRPLPVPRVLNKVLLTDPRGLRAWEVLSALYLIRPDLQRAFPNGIQRFPNNLVSWACTAGITIDSDLVYLLPYRQSYVEMCTAVKGVPELVENSGIPGAAPSVVNR